MRGCLKPKLGQELVAPGHMRLLSKGACLIEIHLHVKSIGGNESACLRQVLAQYRACLRQVGLYIFASVSPTAFKTD